MIIMEGDTLHLVRRESLEGNLRRLCAGVVDTALVAVRRP